MDADYVALSHVALARGSVCASPSQQSVSLDFDSPAVEVMTDFTMVPPRMVDPELKLEAALEIMRIAGVRLLLVAGDEGAVDGIVTSYDIQGERPIRIAAELGVPNAEIRVDQIMTPRSAIRALNFDAVERAQLGNIVATFRLLEQKHILVVDSGGRQVRGLFSAAELGRRIGMDIADIVTPAHSFAELSRELS